MTNWRNPPSKTKETGSFSHFSSIFPPSLPKIGHFHPRRTPFSNKYGTVLSSQKVLSS